LVGEAEEGGEERCMLGAEEELKVGIVVEGGLRVAGAEVEGVWLQEGEGVEEEREGI
jgi:hypothetical protein